MQSSEISKALESWYEKQRSGDLCDGISARLQPILDLAFGYHIAQMGPLPMLGLIQGSPINHRIFVSAASDYSALSDDSAIKGSAELTPSPVSLHCHGDELPFDSDSLDMLVAFHALEFDEHPHGSLREMQRVLRPHGHLVVIGFNPRSLLGISQYLRRARPGSLWQQHRPVSLTRLQDWLTLLHCEVESVQHLYPLPFSGQGRLRAAVDRIDAWAARRELPGGGLYIAHAIKQIGALRRPLPLGVRARKRFAGLAVAGRATPTPRQPGGDRSDIAA